MSLAVAVIAAAALFRQSTPDAYTVAQRAIRAVERDSVPAAEARWTRALATNPTNREALLSLATLARLTYRFERADSMASRLLGGRGSGSDAGETVDDFAVLARLGMAHTLASGPTPARADSVYAQARRDAQKIGSPRLEAAAMLSLAMIRARTQGVRAAMELVGESHRVYPVGLPREEAARLCVEGNLGALYGDTTSEYKLTQAIEVSRKAREWRVYAECRLFRAQNHEHRGYFVEALENLDTAVFWMRRIHADESLAIALQWGAFVRFQRGDLSRARRDYLESVTMAKRTRNAAVEAWALTGLASIAVALSDLSGGQEYVASALALHRARNDRWGYATVRELEGKIADALGDFGAARSALTDAIAVHSQIGQPLLAVNALRGLARLELEQGRFDDAERALQKATQFAKTSQDDGWFGELPFHQAGVALGRGQLGVADSLLRSMERFRSFASMRPDLMYNFWIRSAVLASRQNDLEATEQAMQRAMRVLAQWRLGVDDKDVRLQLSQARLAWGNIGDEYPALIGRLSAAGRVTSAFALAEATRARELVAVTLQQTALDPDSARLHTVVSRLRQAGDVSTLSQVQQSLDDSTALLAYVAGRGRSPTTVFIVSRRAATARTLAPVDSIATTLDRYLRLTSDGTEPTALARQLSDALITDAVGALPASVSRLLIVPELSLYRVPFDALLLPDGRYVVERFTIAVVPSATFAVTQLRAAAEHGAERATGSLLAFGDANYPAAPSLMRSGATGGAGGVGGAGASDPLQTMPRLPFSGDEVRRVARYAGRAKVLVRADASENALRTADLSSVRVLHFATHALMDDRSLQRNMLALTPNPGNDGLLGPQELGALHLNHALVVLSGCRTVGGMVLGGEGLRGLTAPLLEAGARAVVATQWAIGDESALPFVDRFYAHLARGIGVGTALRRAKLDAIRDHVRPSLWAAFVLVGDGTMRAPLTPIAAKPLSWGKARATR